MTTQQVTILITALTISTQAGLYLISGGFTLGSRVSDVTSEIRLLRAEVISQNEIQNYRIGKLEDLRAAKFPN